MHYDLIQQLGYKALDTRLKRISDRMIHDVRKLYKELGLDIEPRWYLVLQLLKEKESLSIVDIASHLEFAHPSVVVLIKKMQSEDYVTLYKDSKDQRKQIVSLSKKAKQRLPELEQLWESCDSALLEVLENDLSILEYLDRIEQQLKQQSFYERYKTAYNTSQNQSS